MVQSTAARRCSVAIRRLHLLDSRCVENLKLRFPGPDPVELPLGTGMHAISFDPDRGTPMLHADANVAASVRFCVDRRGVWLTVGEGVRGVHVNGRPVQRMAMLRSGDVVFVDGSEIVLTTANQPEPLPVAIRNTPSDGSGDVRTVLRGVGGHYHGRSFTLERPRLVGHAADADIHIADPAFAERHARIECHGDAVVLRDLDSASGTLLNGVPVRDALLRPGDQLVFDAHHRFVLESPRTNLPAEPAIAAESDEQPASARTVLHNSARRLPWLLLAALLIAGALGALLMFGAST
jgi:pSer/pThr/pTyr-binding forkhead associated (FHA) protein